MRNCETNKKICLAEIDWSSVKKNCIFKKRTSKPSFFPVCIFVCAMEATERNPRDFSYKKKLNKIAHHLPSAQPNKKFAFSLRLVSLGP